MWIEVVLLSLFFSPSLSSGVSLVRVDPAESDPLCLGDTVKYNCTLQDIHLIWEYSGDESSHLYVSTSATSEPFKWGSFFYSVLESVDPGSSTSIFVSTAASNDGLTAAANGTSISCFGATNFEKDLISFSVPEITNASFGLCTIYWSPPPCDANCTVSVDGQDIGTVPCSDGNLSVESELSAKTVNITAHDQLGQSAVVQAVPAIDMRMSCYVPYLESSDMSAMETPTTMPDASTNTSVIIGIVIPVLFIAIIILVVFPIILHILKAKGRKELSVSYAGKTGLEGVYVDSDEGSDHHEAKTIEKLKKEPRLVSEQAVGNPPSGKNTDGKDNRNTSSNKGQVEHGDGDPSALQPVKTSKKLIVDGEIKVYKCATSSIIHCKISPGGDYIAIAELECCVRVLNCHSGEIVKNLASTSCILSLEWAEYDGEDVLVAAGHTKMKIFSVEKNNTLVDFKLRGFPKHSRVLCLAQCATRSVFALSCQLPRQSSDGVHDHSGQVIIDDYGKGKDKMMCCVKVTSPVSCMVFNYFGTLLITGNIKGKITVFDVQEGDVYTATACCDWSTPHGIMYNLQYSYDEEYVYSTGESDEFILQSKLPISHRPGTTLSISNPPEATVAISHQPETTRLKIKPGAVSTVLNIDERVPVCGQFFCLMPRKKYILTSSYSQGIIYKVKKGNNIVEKLALNPFHADITCVDWMSPKDTTFLCVLGCADNSVHVINIDIKE